MGREWEKEKVRRIEGCNGVWVYDKLMAGNLNHDGLEWNWGWDNKRYVCSGLGWTSIGSHLLSFKMPAYRSR